MQLDAKQISRIGLFIALAMGSQQLRLQWITGPMINAILILTVVFCGLGSAILVGSLTPLAAFFQGIMLLAVMLPFIALGNILLCLIVQLLQRFLPGVLFGPLFKSLVLVSGAVLVTGLPFRTALLMGLLCPCLSSDT